MINDQPNILPALSAHWGDNAAYNGILELMLDLRNLLVKNR